MNFMRSSRFFWLSTFLLLLTLFITPFESAQAAKVFKVKGRKVLIKLQETEAKKGEVFYLVNKKGRKKGIIRILKIKGSKAIAKVTRGKAKKGYKLKVRNKKEKSVAKKSSKGSPKGDSFLGVTTGFGSSNMTATIETSSKTVDLTGSSMSLKALYDYAIFEKIWFRGLTGYESFNVGGASDSNCTPSGECEAKIGYLTADLWGRFLFSLSSMRPWIGAGFNLLFPLSKSATVINEESISNTSVIAIGGGIDWFINSTSFVPIQIEYEIFPKSAQVSANTIHIRAGYGWSF